ncbi:fimbrillin family protein [Marseilla massiliensis]|uniref:Fimbrillin family protein n=2 Tax=Marseilla massiliensis TaxID=1841864 RepID=A0A938WRB8_9BACT|nr:GLUG motif-containing protein [Marseilla massiliensis]MBM6672689.1 fimbrillin family protein [Marseilla massiliensis]
MSIRYSYHIGFVALLLLLAACTKDELADGDRLPEGQYPLEIARITLGVEGGEAQPWGTPQTRVSENGDGKSSTFDAGDRFAVQIDGEGEVGTYTVRDDGSVEAETPLYWSDRDEAHTVSAWYPATDGTLDLGDQSQSLAYLLGGTGTGDYQTPVTLTFAHRLAKVRVTPSDDALDQVQSLQLYTYTQCTYEKGTVVQGSQEGWIEMKKCEYTENGNAITCWEANVVPGYTITKLQANGTEERNLSAAITPEAGKFYNITLNKDKGYTVSEDGNTYEVYNAEGLKNIASLVNSGATDINITLDTDLDLTDMEWTPIGADYNNAYTGIFDGNGKTITGLTVNQEGTNYVGLIGYLGSGGKVQNVTLTDVSVTGYWYVGGVVGANDKGTVTACTASGSISGSSRVGGVVGYNGGTMTGCTVSGSVSGDSSVGGVVGWNGGTVTACYDTSDVSGYSDVGGVAGRNYYGTVTGCTSSGSVSGSLNVGGVVGYNYGIVTACYWSGLPDNDNGGATKVDGTTVTWQNAVDAMNTALQSAGSEWRYELTGELPTLKKQ